MAGRSNEDSMLDADRRGVARTRLLQPARLSWEGGSADCLICDISAVGAQLRLPDARRVEGVAELQIFGLGVLACRPIRQQDSVVGLRFCATSSAVARVLGGFSGAYADAS